MPYINVRVAGALTKEQKQQLVKEITETMTRVCNKPPEATYITLDEVDRENWAKAGKLLTDS